MDHLAEIARARQQLAAALAALPHDIDEAGQRIQAALADLASHEAVAERDLDAMARWYDDGGSVEVAGRADQ